MRHKKKVWTKQSTNIKNKRRNSAIDLMDIKKKIKEYYEQLCGHKFDNLDEIVQFAKT